MIVQFTSDTFTATEASGTMSVGLVLSGGVFDRDLTISVTTMEQSATGRDMALYSSVFYNDFIPLV